MRILGIDWGEKKVGVAVSDEDGRIAFPMIILTNNSSLISKIENICKNGNIKKIVLGESPDMMKETSLFKNKLETKLKLPVFLEPEFMTSVAARRGPISKKPKARLEKKVKELVDAKAAALILQRHLDKINKK